MKFLSDKALDRLRELGHLGDAPDLAGTRYVLLERVARGGMGLIYASRDAKPERRVALKVLDGDYPGGQLARRMIREAQGLATLEHPRIEQVHNGGTVREGPAFY